MSLVLLCGGQSGERENRGKRNGRSDVRREREKCTNIFRRCVSRCQKRNGETLKMRRTNGKKKKNKRKNERWVRKRDFFR